VSTPRHHGTSRQQEPRNRFELQHAAAREFRTLAELAQAEAAARGASAIEAEHVLIALADMPQSRGGAFLVANGLDRDTLDAALAAERRHSLGSVGAPLFGDDQLAATRRKVRPRWGASSRDALDRGMRVSRSRENASTLNLVVGALMAELGTVPRMLALAGVDRHQILGRATVEAAKGQR
jgi:D-alanyl-D-alanine carboxypeptidase